MIAVRIVKIYSFLFLISALCIAAGLFYSHPLIFVGLCFNVAGCLFRLYGVFFHDVT